MQLQDFATKDYIFQTAPDFPRRGLLTCRHCKTKVVVQIKISTFLILASSKIRVFGKWCKCSSLPQIIHSLIGESIGIEGHVEKI